MNSINPKKLEQAINTGQTAVKTTSKKQGSTGKEQRWQPNPSLTKKQNNFVRYVINNPTHSDTRAVKETYDTDNKFVHANIASRLRKNPEVQAELAKYTDTAESNLIKLANATTDFAMTGDKNGAAYAAVSERVNNSILDRIQGKATQPITGTVNVVQLNVDLTSAQ